MLSVVIIECVMREVLKNRLDELNINAYKLARRVAKSRGDVSQQRSISSQMSRIIENSESSKLSNVREVVEAMGGTIVIRWNKVEEIEI